MRTMPLIFWILAVSTPTFAADAIRIGWIGPLTGPAAALGVDSVPAIELVFEAVNKGGGINGRELKLVIEDDQYQTSKTVTAFERLVKQEKLDVIFTITYGGLFAIAKNAARSQVLLIDPLDCDDAIAALPEYVICIAKKTEDLAFANADFALEKRQMPAAFIYFDGDPFMGTAAKASIERIKSAGGEVAYAEGYMSGTTDFKSQLVRIKETGARALFFYGYDEMGIAMKQARGLGIAAQFFAMNTISSPGFREAAGSAAEFSYVGSWFAPKTKRYEEFLKRFKEKVGRAPYLEISTVPSFDAAEIIVQSLRKETLEGKLSKSLQESFYKVRDYEGLSGTITIDADGIVRTLKNEMFSFQGGELKRVK